jgi:hypothetical protein
MALDYFSGGNSIAQQAGLLESLGGATVSGLAYAGGLLDKLTGARALRGLLGGRPEELLSILPGSDTFGLTNEENSLSGRDLLEQYGALSPNQPGLDLGDVGGFLAEVALDPSAWASFGASTLGKKLLPEAAAAGLQTLGRAPSLPTRYAATKGLDDIGLHSDFLGSIPGGQLLNKGLYGGTQDLLDNTQLGRDVRRSFQPEVRERRTRFGQDLGREVTDTLEQTRAKVRMGTTDLKGILERGGALEDSAGMRAAMEGAEPASDVIGEAAVMAQKRMDEYGQRLVNNGSIPTLLQDASGSKFAPRGYTEEGLDKWGGGGKGDPFGMKRKEFLKHVKDEKLGATGQLQQIIQDPELLKFGDNKEAGKYIAKTYGEKFYTPKIDTDLAKALAEQEAKGNKGFFGLEAIIKEEKQVLNRLKKKDPNAAPSALQIAAQGAIKGTKNRMTRLASYARKMTPERRAVGVFDRHILADVERYSLHADSVLAAQEAVLKSVPDLVKMVGEGTKTTTVKKLLAKTKLNKNENGLAQIADAMGIDISTPAGKKEANNLLIPLDEARDIAGLVKTNTDPKEISNISKAWDSYTSMFKAGVLTWPARFSRDATTGFYLNKAVHGVSLSKDYADAAKILGKDAIGAKVLNLGDSSGVVEDAVNFPAIKEMLEKRGLENNPENATQALKDLVYAYEVISKRTMETSGAVKTPASSLNDLLGQMVGTNQVGVGKSLKQAIPRSLEEAWPGNIRGVAKGMVGEVRQESKFAPVKAGEELGYVVEGMNRLPLFISELRKGTDPLTASKKVLETHVDYRPESFTNFEKGVKKVVPFYAWNRKALPFVLRQLWDKPGGAMGQTIRGQRNLTESSDTYVPDDLRAQTAFPVTGMDEKGMQRFVTGFGLPQESVLENVAIHPTFGGTAEHTLQKLFGQFHPAIKAPVEFALGKQFFGGRELADLDSPTERIQRNLTGDAFDIPIWADQILANSPLTRATNTLRTLTDPRKDLLAKGINLATGVKVTDADLPKRLEAEIRESSAELLAGQSRDFESLYVPKRTLEALEASGDPEWQPTGSKRRLLQLYQSTNR